MITIEQVLEVLKRTIILEILSTKSTTTIHGLGWLLIIFLTTVVISHHLPYFCQGSWLQTWVFGECCPGWIRLLRGWKRLPSRYPCNSRFRYQASYESRCSGLLPTPSRQTKTTSLYWYKGKTTASYFAFNILKQSHKPAMLSTMNTTLDGKPSSNLT